MANLNLNLRNEKKCIAEITSVNLVVLGAGISIYFLEKGSQQPLNSNIFKNRTYVCYFVIIDSVISHNINHIAE